jgi:predicted SnoaL-like aldol condensation-catalyzing enzyme
VYFEGVNIDRIKDGKIVEHWGAANTLEALAGIGALPFRRD